MLTQIEVRTMRLADTRVGDLVQIWPWIEGQVIRVPDPDARPGTNVAAWIIIYRCWDGVKHAFRDAHALIHDGETRVTWRSRLIQRSEDNPNLCESVRWELAMPGSIGSPGTWRIVREPL